VSVLYIPRINPFISLQQDRQTDLGNVKISHRYMSVGTGLEIPVSFLGINKWELVIYIGL
jgi:hypothetical protein